jgi:hypothetical protein
MSPAGKLPPGIADGLALCCICSPRVHRDNGVREEGLQVPLASSDVLPTQVRPQFDRL